MIGTLHPLGYLYMKRRPYLQNDLYIGTAETRSDLRKSHKFAIEITYFTPLNRDCM